MAKRYSNDIVMAFGDTHFPYEHKDTMEFLKFVKDDYKPDRVVHLGDILDVYSVSSYPNDVDHKDSWTKEIKKARKKVAELVELFPDMDVMESNHDDRAYKKSRISGIPREFMMPFKEIIGAPDGWKWHPELTITSDASREQMFFAHTKTGGSLIVAKDRGCTAVIGHHHSKFGMQCFSPKRGKNIYGVDAGCLISDKGSPFKYNKGDRGRPVQGCVVLIEGVPHMIPMN